MTTDNRTPAQLAYDEQVLERNARLREIRREQQRLATEAAALELYRKPVRPHHEVIKNELPDRLVKGDVVVLEVKKTSAAFNVDAVNEEHGVRWVTLRSPIDKRVVGSFLERVVLESTIRVLPD